MQLKIRNVWYTVGATIDLKNAVLSIHDGGSNTLEVTIGEGNFTWTEKKTREYKLNRGVLNTVRNADEEPVDVSFDFEWDYIKGPSEGSTVSGGVGTPTIEDCLKNVGGAADWASSDADACNPYCVDLVLVYTPPCSGVAGDIETITISDFRYEQLSHDAAAGSITCTGRANITSPTTARTAQT